MGNLIIGENLSVLKNKEGLDESYKLVYLDPPYNTCSNKSYDDTKNSDEWTEDIKDRLIALKPYLSIDGFLIVFKPINYIKFLNKKNNWINQIFVHFPKFLD